MGARVAHFLVNLELISRLFSPTDQYTGCGVSILSVNQNFPTRVRYILKNHVYHMKNLLKPCTLISKPFTKKQEFVGL